MDSTPNTDKGVSIILKYSFAEGLINYIVDEGNTEKHHS